jgi:hypothetical protein
MVNRVPLVPCDHKKDGRSLLLKSSAPEYSYYACHHCGFLERRTTTPVPTKDKSTEP